MNEELMEEVVNNEVCTEEAFGTFEETESKSSMLPGVLLGVGAAVLSGVAYKKWLKPGFMKIKDKFKKTESSDLVEASYNEVIEDVQEDCI